MSKTIKDYKIVKTVICKYCFNNNFSNTNKNNKIILLNHKY